MLDKLKQVSRWFIKLISKLALAIVLAYLIFIASLHIYVYYISEYGINIQVRQLYYNLVTQTGQSQDALPLIIRDDDEDNAWNNGMFITITSGLIRRHNWDEIALVLGHEIAHGMLAHLNKKIPIPTYTNHEGQGDNDLVSTLEANADKLGAVYMMKAGYDVCNARKVFLGWKERSGNSLGQAHPDFSYRFDELNINCD